MADNFSRRNFQMHFCLGALRVNIMLLIPLKLFQQKLTAVINGFSHFSGVLMTNQCIFNGMCMEWCELSEILFSANFETIFCLTCLENMTLCLHILSHICHLWGLKGANLGFSLFLWMNLTRTFLTQYKNSKMNLQRKFRHLVHMTYLKL